MKSTLREMFRHNLWANQRLLEACEALSEDQMNASAVGTYGSVHDTLAHLVRAEENYVALLTNEWPERLRNPPDRPSLAEMRERSRASGEALIGLAESVPPDRVLRGERAGEPYSVFAGYVFVQVVNHATEHRAHVSTIVSQQGATAPELDGWHYAREKESGRG
jgi:uncharacterized damage-inducible protein DinB